MPEDPQRQVFNDAISGDRAERLATDLGHQKSRLVIQEVVKDYVNSTEFAGTVENIQLRTLEADPARNKLKAWAIDLAQKELSSDVQQDKLEKLVDTRVEKYLRERGLRNKNFWIPTTISAIAAIAAVIAIFVN